MKRERCVGSLGADAGDCLRPVTRGLFCFGYLDLVDDDLRRPRTTGTDADLVPMLFPVCEIHAQGLADWAWYLWGDVAGAIWVPPQAFEMVKRDCEMDEDPLLMSPDPSLAVGVRVGVAGAG